MSDEHAPQHPRGGVMYAPTEEQRRMAKVMSGFGIPQTDIAGQIGIDTKTLRKHFREELDRGMTEANMRVAQSLFSMATTGNSVAAAIFWMKARAGWREKSVVEHTGADGRPSYVIHGGPVPDDALTAEAWAEMFRPGGNPAAPIGPGGPLTIDVPEPE